MIKPIFISYIPLTAHCAKNWHMDFLYAQGIPVEYWDLSPVLNLGFSRKSEIVRDYVKQFYSLPEFETKIHENISNTLFIQIMNLDWSTINIYRVLSRSGAKTAQFSYCGPEIYNSSLGWQMFLSKFSEVFGSPRRLSVFFGNRFAALYKKVGLIKNYDVVFAAGGLSAQASAGAAKIVQVNHPDYDNFQSLNYIDLPGNKYNLFLDSYLAKHPDLAMVGYPALNSDGYYTSLNSYFNLIEKCTGLPVVIAAHPYADYDMETFAGRQIFKGRTAELVARAENVFSHASTAITYAVLAHKPLIFIYTKEMRELWEYTYYKYIQAVANCLACTPVDVDRAVQIGNPGEVVVSEREYKKFKYDFMTSLESESKKSQSIVLEYLKNNSVLRRENDNR